MTYIEIVNDVLIRLREAEVQNVSSTPYSKLIGKYVNDAKRFVEDSYNWNALTATVTVATTPSLFNYVLVGAGQRFKVVDVVNSEEDVFLKYVPNTTITNWMLNTNSTQTGAPLYYNFNGVDLNGDTQVDLYPVPDAVYNIYFNTIVPQAALSADSDMPYVPVEPIIKYAYAMATAERGEDQGLSVSEARALADQSLADAIAIENGRYRDEYVWHSV